MHIIFVKKDYIFRSRNINHMIYDHIYGFKIVEGYKILRVRPNRKSYVECEKESINNIPVELAHSSEIIFDTDNNNFHKNIYGVGGIPSSMISLMEAVEAIGNNVTIEYLNNNFSMKDIVEAIYLTGTLSKFFNGIDVFQYHMIKYEYGHKTEIPQWCITEMIDKYPERLI